MLLESSAPNRGNYPMVEVRGQSQRSDWYEPRRGRFASIFGVAFRGETYRRALYLLTILPLGIIYFTLLGMAFSLGGGLALIVLGLVILVGALFAWPAVAEIERRFSNHMLRTRIEPLVFNPPQGPGLWPEILARLNSTSTWQSLLYLVIRLPLGIFALISVVLSFALAPVTLTMSLHLANGMAKLIAAVNRAILQPWGAPALVGDGYAASSAAAQVPPQAVAANEPGVAEAGAPSEPPGVSTATGQAGGTAPPFSEKARRGAASFTDRVQEITDELSERARAAARGWNEPSGGPATAPATVAASGLEAADSPAVDEPGGEQPDEPARIMVDVAMRIVTVNDEEVELTPKEFDLLVLFVHNPARPFSRDELLDRIWRNDYEVTDRTIDTHVQRLRKKLGPGAELIQTVWGVGYKYQPPRD